MANTVLLSVRTQLPCRQETWPGAADVQVRCSSATGETRRYKAAVYLVNGKLGSALLLKMYKAVPLRLVRGISGDFAGQNGAKGTEGVMQGLVVYVLV